jgi:hypothetical protein
MFPIIVDRRDLKAQKELSITKGELTRRHVLRITAGLTAACAIQTTTLRSSIRAMATKISAQKTKEPVLADIRDTLTRFYEASKLPPLPPSEYQLLFSSMARYATKHGNSIAHTERSLNASFERRGSCIQRKDIGFILNVAMRPGINANKHHSPAVLARSCHSFVLTKCRLSGIKLSRRDRHILSTWLMTSPAKPDSRVWSQRSRSRSPS